MPGAHLKRAGASVGAGLIWTNRSCDGGGEIRPLALAVAVDAADAVAVVVAERAAALHVSVEGRTFVCVGACPSIADGVDNDDGLLLPVVGLRAAEAALEPSAARLVEAMSPTRAADRLLAALTAGARISAPPP